MEDSLSWEDVFPCLDEGKAIAWRVLRLTQEICSKGVMRVHRNSPAVER